MTSNKLYQDQLLNITINYYFFQLMLFDLTEREFDIWEADGTIPIAGVMIMIAVGKVKDRRQKRQHLSEQTFSIPIGILAD